MTFGPSSSFGIDAEAFGAAEGTCCKYTPCGLVDITIPDGVRSEGETGGECAILP